jgi:CheY-like chemotaxis protein
MSKTQDGFLGKVSKGFKKRIYDDEPDAASGKLIIERLQSLAGSGSPGQSKETVERTPDAVGAVNAQEPSSVAAPAAFPPVYTGYRAVENGAGPSPPPEQHQDESPAGKSPVSEELNPIRTSGHMATILVVEDDIVTQRLTRMILEERGYEVVVAEDGVDALMALGKITFDLILCDINMPNLDGFKLVEFLNTKNIFIPVIFITIREDVEDEIRGLALGAKDYIHKPINRDLLLLRIRKALDK